MIELTITAQLRDSAEPEIIGIKESLYAEIEKLSADWLDVCRIDVKTAEPKQITMNDLEQRKEITVEAAIEEAKTRKLTAQEMQNFIKAFIELTKIR